MKTDKVNMEKTGGSYKTVKEKVNPFLKLTKDKERITDAVNNNQPLSSLKDIKFVRPL